MNPVVSNAQSDRFSFPDWAARLRDDSALTPGLREAYRRALTAFLQSCARRGTRPSVAAAREHVELARLEQAPSPGRLQEWKDALNWYFRGGRETEGVALRGVPPLARTDLGATAWEAALVANLRQQQRSWRTEQTYRGWLWRFMRWCKGKAVADVTGADVRAFLTRLTVEERVTGATQKQALNALVFLYAEALHQPLGELGDFARAQRPARRPEVARVLDAVEADYALPLRLLYGSGLRLMEALRLRVVRPTPTPGPPASKGQGGDRLTGPNPGRALLSICVAFSCLLRLIP